LQQIFQLPRAASQATRRDAAAASVASGAMPPQALQRSRATARAKQ